MLAFVIPVGLVLRIAGIVGRKIAEAFIWSIGYNACAALWELGARIVREVVRRAIDR